MHPAYKITQGRQIGLSNSCCGARYSRMDSPVALRALNRDAVRARLLLGSAIPSFDLPCHVLEWIRVDYAFADSAAATCNTIFPRMWPANPCSKASRVLAGETTTREKRKKIFWPIGPRRSIGCVRFA